jgi:hypothetical protein
VIDMRKYFIVIALLVSVVVTAESAAETNLKEIMQGLRDDLLTITDGLVTDNFDTIVTGATGIANHDAIPGQQVQLVLAELGSEMASFKQFDTQVHDLALSIAAAAKAQDRETVMSEYQQMIGGCVGCHVAYKERVAAVLSESNH